MVMSVNTNIGAMVALQHLNTTNDALEKTQLKITTGLKINGPKDDAATYAIAQNMRGEISGWSSVGTSSLNASSALSVIDTALTNMNQKLANLGSVAKRVGNTGYDRSM